jgi:hypothetical protein
MLIGFPVMATNMILSNAYVHHRRHDGFVLKRAFFAAFGNLLTVAAVILFSDATEGCRFWGDRK